MVGIFEKVVAAYRIFYPGIRLEKMTKITKTFSIDSGDIGKIQTGSLPDASL
jgi:hypothetical protein